MESASLEQLGVAALCRATLATLHVHAGRIEERALFDLERHATNLRDRFVGDRHAREVIIHCTPN
ncbi:MAG: hypothetical protein ABIY55_31585 [Kofleriaceae bacterium]